MDSPGALDSGDAGAAQPRSPSRRSARARLLACALAALSALGAATALAAKPKAGSYSGATGEKNAVTFKVAADQSRILSFKANLGYNGECGQGGGPGYEIDVASIRIHAHGRFKASTKGTLRGLVPPVTIDITGVVSGAHAHGTIVEPGNKCSAPNQSKNPYSTTFSASVGKGRH
jgi:hypothetical protein